MVSKSRSAPGGGKPAGAKLPQPSKPQVASRETAKAVATLSSASGTSATLSALATGMANPGGMALGVAAAEMDGALASATNSLSALLPAFPAATLTSLALGIPHAHIAHPPSGPPPIPPTPLPPLGPVLLGTCLQVLINGKPAARCGDIGLNPTCCGLPPMFEIFTGSSKVFFGGARAARVGVDITMHCKPTAGGSRAAAMSAKVAAKASLMAKVARVAATTASAAAKVLQIAAVADEFQEAAAEDDAAMSAAMGLNATMMAAQMAADAAALAASAAMGKDPVVPPTGTPGAILVGSPNVLIGGVPLPCSLAIAQGLLKRVKGLRRGRGGRGRSRGRVGAPT